ncbi:hypothetical protein [Devosia aquimaris]|uniref:hypothetical protein n=1 Tax=Devosia aquimaris TaxID=2866214 RepID=UPI001CD157EC|nr:hypothetical protein [Devosia sp. CJK-A8-3]
MIGARYIKQVIAFFCILGSVSPPASSADTIKFLSWNVSNYVPASGYSYRGAIGTRRLEADLLAIRQILADGYDALLLQEAVNDLAVRSTVGPLYSVLSTEEYREIVSAPPQLERLVQPFVAIAENATLQVAETESWRLDGAVDGNYLTRDILYVQLAWGQQKIGLVHAHMKSGCNDTLASVQLDCRLMNSQFEAIGAGVEQKIGLVDALLVIGDFNRELLNPRLKQWRDDKVPWAREFIAIPPCWLRPSPQPIDFVIVAKLAAGLRLATVPIETSDLELLLPNRISDHCPVAFELAGG